ncbi:glycoside hydrolase family 18 protein [Athelia psychrophila]|uniref:chitinase n=1 Tax=Athelia psychrophila TaxID=1759441 RepID=A0A166N2N7_9AGAM|nr:glycoside hydrolase family 18 protein [Fibularhizoctonia sp. CBS 109695]
MVAFTFSRLAAAITAIACVGSSLAAPLIDARAKPSTETQISSAAPHFVIYSDSFVSGTTPDVSAVAGYNVFALSFWLLSGAADQAEGWTELSADQRSSVVSTYHDAGINIIVSAFGSTDTPTTSGADPTDTANTLAAWVKQYGLDGVDVDYEDEAAFNGGTGSAEQWLITFFTVLRAALPEGQYIITGAPLAPWFQPNGRWGGGGFLLVDQKVGSLVDWWNVQFYNQGTTEYTTCAGLFTQSSSSWPQTSLFEIAASGVAQNKLVVGKPATSADATNGYIDPATLAGCVQTAAATGWSGGVMVWEFPDAAAAWIATVRGSAWPEATVTANITGGSSP